MDLPTHFLFGLAVSFVFFGNPEIALMVGLGALLPDLDREYWFFRARVYADEQIHRAGLHNVFVMAFAYLISPFLSLGVFLHVLQDSFTTVKDRGVEWFFPITRLVKRGMYDSQGVQQPLDPTKHVYFYQEDPHGLVEYADKDLQEPGPVPWRRVYGFAQNSHMLDRGFLFGSAGVLLAWLTIPLNATHFYLIEGYLFDNRLLWGVGFGWVVATFVAGELDRRDSTVGPRLGRFNFVKYPLLVLGLAGLVGWVFIMSSEVQANLASIFSNPALVVVSCVAVLIIGAGTVIWQTRNGKNTMV